jgi:hypothetical protein
VSADAKTCVEEVFRLLGGVPAMKRWAEAEPSAFYAIYSKLLPKAVDVTASGGQVLGIVVLPALDASTPLHIEGGSGLPPQFMALPTSDSTATATSQHNDSEGEGDAAGDER